MSPSSYRTPLYQSGRSKIEASAFELTWRQYPVERHAGDGKHRAACRCQYARRESGCRLSGPGVAKPRVGSHFSTGHCRVLCCKELGAVPTRLCRPVDSHASKCRLLAQLLRVSATAGCIRDSLTSPLPPLPSRVTGATRPAGTFFFSLKRTQS